MPDPRIVSFINYKGGVGKSTTTYHVGCSLAQHHGKRVLLIDIDPQTNLTFLCASYEEWLKQKARAGTIATVYERFLKKQAMNVATAVWRTPIRLMKGRIAKLDLIPCDLDLLGEDLGVAGVSIRGSPMQMIKENAKAYLRERDFLKRMIAEIDAEYDVILIDCPPNLYTMTQNALVASDHYLITAIPDHLSTIGLNILQRKVDGIGGKMRDMHTLAGSTMPARFVAELGGVIFVKVRLGGSRITRTHANTMASVATEVGQKYCFETHTTELIGYGEASEQSLPVWEASTQNAINAADKHEYERIASEFKSRFL